MILREAGFIVILIKCVDWFAQREITELGCNQFESHRMTIASKGRVCGLFHALTNSFLNFDFNKKIALEVSLNCSKSRKTDWNLLQYKSFVTLNLSTMKATLWTSIAQRMHWIFKIWRCHQMTNQFTRFPHVNIACHQQIIDTWTFSESNWYWIYRTKDPFGRNLFARVVQKIVPTKHDFINN